MRGLDVHFFVSPGGTGPYFDVQDDRLEVLPWSVNDKAPPRQHPAGTSDIPLSSFEAVVVCALGYVDGGFAFANPMIRQGVLHRFRPLKPVDVPSLVSTPVMTSVVHHMLGQHPGMRFLAKLRMGYAGPILVAPFPYLSEDIKTHEGWTLGQMYEDAAGANEFFAATRDQYLRAECARLGATLLSRPAEAVVQGCFSSSSYMTSTDMVHPNHRYGRLVLELIRQELRRGGSAC
jgi:hypothetical protein